MQPASTPHPDAALALWPLPLVAGLMPAGAALLALGLSMHQGLVPACNPFIEGCVSISRAARHELPNHLFRAIVMPAAVLQAITWLLAARWLAGCGEPRRWLAPLGVTAGAALVLYAAFLGTEGPTYRWLRQYGTVVYFGFTCLCMLLCGGAIRRLTARACLAVPAALARTLVGLTALLLALGLTNALFSPLLAEPGKDRLQNVTEWWAALVLTGLFLVLGAAWRRCGLSLRLQDGPPG